MSRPKPPSRTNLLGLGLAAALAACGPLVQIGGNDKPPAALFTLRATPRPMPAQADPTKLLLVAQPVVPGALQTLRVPVITRDTELAYLAGATWIEQPSRLFQRLLADVVGASGVTVLTPRVNGPIPALQLGGQLLEFGLDVREPANPQVRVRFDAILVGRDGQLVGARRFEVAQPTPSQTPADVAAALNSAANEVANQVASWVAAR